MSKQFYPGQGSGIYAGFDFPQYMPADFIQSEQSGLNASVTLWTPDASTAFRLLGWDISITANAAQTTAGTILVTLLDGGVSTGISFEVAVPAVSAATAGAILVSRLKLNGGYKSKGLGNVLTASLSAALIAGSFNFTVFGIEE